MELEIRNGESTSRDNSFLAGASDAIRSLVAEWKAAGKDLRHWGAEEGLARAYERCAQQLESALAIVDNGLLSVREAVALTGRHRDTIGKAIANGALTNYGTKYRPRLRYADLVAHFPQQRVAGKANGSYDGCVDARAFLGTRRGDTG